MSKTELMTVEEVAILLRVSDSTIRRLAQDGEIPGSMKVGGSWRFNRGRISDMIEGDLNHVAWLKQQEAKP